MDAVQRGEALKASSNSIAFFRSKGEVMGNGISKTSPFVFHIKERFCYHELRRRMEEKTCLDEV